MSYFNRNKWWAIAFLLLIAFNVATLIAFWLIRDRDRRPGPPMERSGVVEFLVKELGFDSVQKQKLAHLHDEHQMKMKEVRRNNREAKNAFFDLLQQHDIPDSTLQKAAKESAKYDAETDMLTFRHFQQVRELCNETQKKKFDAVIQQVLRMIAPPPPGNQPGPPPGRGEGPDGPPPGSDDRRPPPPPQ
jgi:protein CpxP